VTSCRECCRGDCGSCGSRTVLFMLQTVAYMYRLKFLAPRPIVCDEDSIGLREGIDPFDRKLSLNL
jgi:hypothetical protein